MQRSNVRLATPGEIWQSLRAVSQTVTLTQSKSRYVLSAIFMSTVLLLMSVYQGSPIPFILVVFGQIALYCCVRLPGIYLPGVVVAVTGSLLGIMIPWTFISHITVLVPVVHITLSAVLSFLAVGPYWLIEILWEIASQIKTEK